MIQRIKTYFALFRIAMVTIVLSSWGIIFSPFDKRFRMFYKYGLMWAQGVLWAARVKVQVIGMEHISPDENYVFVPNHTSYFDIPAIWAGLNRRVRFIYRKSLEKVPIWGWEMKRSPFIGIERENARDGMAGINEALEVISSGDADVIIFPEGTRSPNGKLGEFKRGAFMLASRSARRIVPVTILGAREIMPPGTFDWTPGTITIILSPPLDPCPNDRIAEKALLKTVREHVAQNLPEEYRG